MSSPAPVHTKPARRAPPSIRGAAAQVLAALARQTCFVDPALVTQWPLMVGEELAGLCRPGRLTGGRIGRTLELITPNGAAAARIAIETEAIRRRVNDFLGPGAVERVVIRQGGGEQPPSLDDDDPRPDGPVRAALSRFRATLNARGDKQV